MQAVRLEHKYRKVLEYKLHDWKTKIVKSSVTNGKTEQQRQPCLNYKMYNWKTKIAKSWLNYILYDWKTKIVKCWNATCATRKQRLPSLGTKSVRLEAKDSHVLENSLYNWKNKHNQVLQYNHYDWKTQIVKSCNTSCTTGKQRKPNIGLITSCTIGKQRLTSLGIKPVRLEDKDSHVLEHNL